MGRCCWQWARDFCRILKSLGQTDTCTMRPTKMSNALQRRHVTRKSSLEGYRRVISISTEVDGDRHMSHTGQTPWTGKSANPWMSRHRTHGNWQKRWTHRQGSRHLRQVSVADPWTHGQGRHLRRGSTAHPWTHRQGRYLRQGEHCRPPGAKTRETGQTGETP